MINGEKIAELRKRKKLSQAKLAKSIGISDTHLSHVENAKAGMSLETLEATAQVLGVAVEELLIDDGLTSASVPGITFEYQQGAQKYKICIPATPEGYQFLTQQLKELNLDPQLQEINDFWITANSLHKKQLYELVQEFRTEL